MAAFWGLRQACDDRALRGGPPERPTLVPRTVGLDLVCAGALSALAALLRSISPRRSALQAATFRPKAVVAARRSA